jgi:hypothetical protein
MRLTKKQRRFFNVVIIFATIGLIISSMAGTLFFLIGGI